ncbi:MULTISPECIES: endonuclease/exonuclease/phosphatase family protein [Streptosporangium]|uniref:Endonuclease/exonuclease/phosphatase family metal-dependent hydrolase n=1 Tax=Streptosporangium brasiliense TaxID=47480 RepID=A0ABT9RFH6_9ACTN|nr:endonuclease/exonuclease/phosphatase family protein [Streptosporangium brasiliense]MDP9867110.1 endonuclease/exonuclease/phosphatase family metal-dependent hydrolase [Streptosporangium brasiliense]
MRIRLDVALGVLVLADVLRVFLPSLITLFGRAGSTPAEMMGLYAVSWFLAAFLAVPLARSVRPRLLATGAGLLLLLARLALQPTSGGDAQLYLASAGLLAGLVWLVATAAAAQDARPAMAGVITGLAAATVTHAALDGIDLMWRPGPLPWLPLAAELALFGIFLLRPRPAEEEHSGAPRAWLTIGPALLLWGLYTGNTAHAQAAAGSSTPLAAAGVAAVVAGFAVVSVAPAAQPLLRRPLVPAVALAASAVAFAAGRATVDGVHGVAPGWTIAAQIIGQVALGACLAHAAATSGPDRPLRRGLAAAGGMLLFVVLVFGYYAAYDLYLPNRWVPGCAALLVALGTAGSTGLPRGSYGRRLPAAVAAAAALVAAVPLWQGTVPRWEPPGDGLRVAAYNIRMGYGLPGRLSLEQQADTLRALRPHVVVLGEADRGWLLNGGHDDVRLIAERLGMRYLWAPAADEVWGDALLTDLPVTSVRNHVLVQGGPTGAQALEVGLRWRNRDITVIATHLQPPPGWRELDQVAQLGRIVEDAARGGRPVVVAGDLNLEPAGPAWRVLMSSGLTDPIAPARPLSTVPGVGVPAEQIDHVLVTPGFDGKDQANPDVHHSDHRPVAVTLVPRS